MTAVNYAHDFLSVGGLHSLAFVPGQAAHSLANLPGFHDLGEMIGRQGTHTIAPDQFVENFADAKLNLRDAVQQCRLNVIGNDWLDQACRGVGSKVNHFMDGLATGYGKETIKTTVPSQLKDTWQQIRIGFGF